MNAGGQQQNNSGIPFSNTRKVHPNLFYCFTCGYAVDHPGVQCPYAGPGHIPNVNRDKAHLVLGASMKAQHKVLPDGSGAGKGWIQAQGVNKAFYTMAQQGQQPWAQVYQQQGSGGGARTGTAKAAGRAGAGGGARGAAAAAAALAALAAGSVVAIAAARRVASGADWALAPTLSDVSYSWLRRLLASE